MEKLIQDIEPKVFSNEFVPEAASGNEPVICIDSHNLLMRENDGEVALPTAAEFRAENGNSIFELCYLFSIDDERYYLPIPTDPTDRSQAPHVEGYDYAMMGRMTDIHPVHLRLAIATATHLSEWYATNRYCGRCRTEMNHSYKERAVVCPNCGNTVYPRINPAIIVGVRDGSRILMTRYPNGYRHRALIAGFCEIGETVEQTVAREVMEETGVAVKNISYYASQPWGIASDILLGFTCDLDGDPTIHIDENELASAEWVEREDIHEEDDEVSLTRRIVMAFKNGEI